MSTEQSRAAFENFIVKERQLLHIDRYESETYCDPKTQALWCAWRKAWVKSREVVTINIPNTESLQAGDLIAIIKPKLAAAGITVRVE